MPLVEISEAEHAAINLMRESGVAPLRVVYDTVDQHQARLRALRDELVTPESCAPYALVAEPLTERDMYDIKLVQNVAAQMLDPHDVEHTPRPWPIPVPVALEIVRTLRRRFEARSLRPHEPLMVPQR
jgi:hypothetical protein